MRKLTALLIFMVVISFHYTLLAQEQDILLTIDDQEITADEFQRIYRKNQQNLDSGDKTAMEDYLDLFIRFKLKVIEAENMQIDTLPSIKNEMEKYSNELAKPYLRDDETMNKMIRQAYERSQQEIKASHILIQIPQPTSYKDTVHAYDKILKIRKRIINKAESFSEVARATSDDPSVKSNGGNLGYFTALQMIYPFENTAYNLNINQISYPVKTQYGYHLIQKTGERKAKGRVKVAHIMLMAPQSMSEEQRQEIKEKIDEIYHKIKSGEEFEKLAREVSEDRGSAQKGGELPWFGVGRMVPAFEKAAFSLEEKGEVSRPVKTSFGWHIIKLLDRKTLGSFEEEKATLENKISKSPRYQITQDSMISRLQKEYNFTEKIQHFHDLYRFINEENNKIAWNRLKAYPQNDSLFVIRNKLFKTKGFLSYLNNLPQEMKKNYEGRYLLDKAYERYKDEKIIEYEKEILPEKYPEYKYIRKEYHDGILLFEVMNRKIWSKASSDTSGLRQYYNDHKDDYMWGERFKGKIYLCDNEKTLKKVKKMKKGGLFRKQHSDQEVLQETNQDSNRVEIKDGIFTKGENNIIDHYAWNMGDKKELENKEPYFVRGELVKPQPKKLEEARGTVLADYQNYLEEQWIRDLKDKYEIRVNEEILDELTKN